MIGGRFRHMIMVVLVVVYLFPLWGHDAFVLTGDAPASVGLETQMSCTDCPFYEDALSRMSRAPELAGCTEDSRGASTYNMFGWQGLMSMLDAVIIQQMGSPETTGRDPLDGGVMLVVWTRTDCLYVFQNGAVAVCSGGTWCDARGFSPLSAGRFLGRAFANHLY